MSRFLSLLVALLFAALGHAQERIAIVELEDGTTVEGRVVRMDVEKLEIVVAGEARTIAAAGIRSCRFQAPTAQPRPAASAVPGTPPGVPQDPSGAAPAGALPGDGRPDTSAAPSVGASGAGSPAQAGEPVKAQDPGNASQVPPAAPMGEGATAPSAKKAPKPRRAPVDVDQNPTEVHLRSRLRERLELLDQRYPWLVPSVPTQWISISLLLFAILSLIVHLSTKVVGCESMSFGRSMGVSLWYMLTGFLQVAMVPVSDMSVAIMLIANTALALFWLRNLFDLSRGGTVIALAVQLGFGVLAFGVLELVNVLLATVETA